MATEPTDTESRSCHLSIAYCMSLCPSHQSITQVARNREGVHVSLPRLRLAATTHVLTRRIENLRQSQMFLQMATDADEAAGGKKKQTEKVSSETKTKEGAVREAVQMLIGLRCRCACPVLSFHSASFARHFLTY